MELRDTNRSRAYPNRKAEMPWSDLPCIGASEGEVMTLQLKKRNDTKI
ncbi:hypothetical protein [Alkalihalobacterium alkalinitrilicum]|nr:hypothetical protein [Alkalihalobacterium alkalinitrilicum]